MNNPNTDSMHRALRAYALKLTCGNLHLADKLYADTLSRIAQTATAHVPTIMPFTTWAKMVMHNTFHATVPDADRRHLYHLTHIGNPNPLIPVSDKEYTLREQMHIMSRLTPHQAAVVTLRLKGYTPAIIAKQMGNTTNHVKAHIQQATHILNHIWDN
jgi:DNA-directed RNA polymerase specialized sigma24 family protein